MTQERNKQARGPTAMPQIDADTCVLVLCVGELPKKRPVFAHALENVLHLFGKELELVLLDQNGSYTWPGEGKPKCLGHSRDAAREFRDRGCRKVLIVVDGERYQFRTPGLLCWFEFFLKEDAPKRTVNVSGLLGHFLSAPEGAILVSVCGQEACADLEDRLYRETVNSLSHYQKALAEARGRGIA
jgi:hypothetical protein